MDMKTITDTQTLLTILQITDTAFPTGGFSHSLGYESAQKHFLIKGKGSYEEFLFCSLENAGSQSLPFVRAGYANYHKMNKLRELDKTCEACLANHVSNRASVKQGRSLVDTASQTFPSNKMVQAMENEIAHGRVLGHQAPLFGALCAALQINLDSAITMFMYSVLKTMVTASVRLGHVGALEGQRTQHRVKECIPDIINRNKNLSIDEVHISFPVVDICQNLHDTMFSKLFYS